MNARDELRNIICSLASNPEDAETKLNAYRSEIRREFAEEIAQELGGCCAECDACIQIARQRAETETAR